MDKNELIDLAKKYCDLNISIFPIVYKNKIPFKGFAWKDKNTSDFLELKKNIMDLDLFNLAMPTGAVNNVFVLDIDKGHNGFETLRDLENKLGKLPDTVTVSTGGGGKHFYFQYPDNYKITGTSSLLGDGIDTRTDNNYVVLPPSTHQSGTHYQWEKGKSIFDIEFAKLPQTWLDALVEASNSNHKNTTNNITPIASTILSDTIKEGNRENSLFRLACAIRGKVKSVDELMLIIQTMNRIYCSSPLEDKEVENAVKSAWKYQEKIQFTPTFYSLKDLKNITFPEPNWIISNFMPSGLHLIAGKPKVGKSWFVLNLALSISNGKSFLDKYYCNIKNILYLALEDTGARIKTRLTNLESIGNDLSHITVTHNWATIKQGGLDLLEKTIVEKKFDIVFIDTLQCFRGPDIFKNKNIYVEDYFVMGELKKIADKYNIAIVLIHHLNKSKTGETFDNVSGSNGIIGACDTIYTLSGTKDYSILSFKGRDVYGDDIYFRLDNGLCVPIDTPYVSTKNISPEQEKVFNIIKSSNNAIGIKEIADSTSYTVENVKYHLLKLKEKGYIETEKRGYYVLTPLGSIT